MTKRKQRGLLTIWIGLTIFLAWNFWVFLSHSMSSSSHYDKAHDSSLIIGVFVWFGCGIAIMVGISVIIIDAIVLFRRKK